MRHKFGGSPADHAMERVGMQLLLRPDSVGTVWDAASGGTQVTDLTDLTGSPIATVTADSDAVVAFYGPDGVTDLYVDFGYGRRYIMAATDLGDILTTFTAQGGAPGGWAQLDGSGKMPLTQLPTAAVSEGLVFTTPTGAVSYVIWRAPRDCTVTAVRGYRQGGTGATINATIGGLDLLATDLSLSTATTWMAGPTLQNTAVSAGAALAVAVRSVSGTPTAVTIQVDVEGL